MVGAIIAGDLHGKPLPVPFGSEFLVESWGLDQGFPQNSCSGIAESPDGYLWIGTFRGLVRFNGHEFKAWAPAALPVLKSTTIISIHRDRRQRTWFSTAEGLVVNEGDHWTRILEAEGWDDRTDYARSFAEDRNGNLVIGRFSGRVMRYEDGRVTELPPPPGQGGAFCAFGLDGTLYVARAGFAGYLADREWRPLQADFDPQARVVGAGQDRAGDAIIVCRDEILRVGQGRVAARTRLTQEVTPFWQLTQDSAGDLWLGSVEAGVYRIKPDGTVKHLLKADGLPNSGGIRFVHADDQGGIWVGGGVGGFTRLRPARFRFIGELEGLGDREVSSLTSLADGRILIASYGKGLLAFDGVAVCVTAAPAQESTTYFRAALRTRDNTIWVGAHNGGLLRLEGTTLVPAARDLLAASEAVGTLFEDSRGRLWVGGERNLLLGEHGAFRRVLPPRERSDPRPTFLAERQDGTVLIARHNEIHAFDSGGLSEDPLLRLAPEVRISSVLVDARNRTWIGTQGHGLFLQHEGKVRHLDPNAGLPSGPIGALVEDDHGALWFGAGRSAVRVDAGALARMAEDPSHRAPLQLFDENDGLRELDFPLGTQPTVAKDARGRLWFAMVRGVAMIDPSELRAPEKPAHVVVEWISYIPDGATRPVEIELSARQPAPVLPPGSRLIRIGYAALDFASPGKQRYRVQLGDELGQWQDMQRETVVSFLELPPGHHTLRIQSAGSDGVWQPTQATLHFELAPYFWQTGWFRGLVGLGLLGLAGGAAWLASDRRTRVAREKLERERRFAESQARLGLVMENTSDFIAFADAAESLTYLNPAGRHLLGLEASADSRSLRTPTLMPAWAREAFAREALPAALRHGTWTGESALLHRDGHEIPVSMVVLAHRRSDQALEFTSMIARDISTSKWHSMVQDALRNLATSLTAALEPHSLGLTVAEACRRLFAHDAFFLVLLNARGEVTLGAYMEDTAEDERGPREVPPTITSFTGQMRPVLQGAPILINRPLEARPDAVHDFEPWGHITRRSMSIVLAPVLWEGSVVGVVSVQSYTPQRYGEADVQQLKTLADHCGAAIARMEAESLLRKNEERLRLAMRSARMGSWEIDVPSRTLHASPEAEDVYGYVRGTLSGPVENLTARIREPQSAELLALLARLLEGAITEIDHRHQVLLADGSERWLELKGHRQRDDDSPGSDRIIGVTSDITSRRLAELERTRLEGQLRQAQKLEAIGTLAGGIAHDFNNILTAILSNAELGLLDTEPEHPAHDSLTKIKKSGQRARDLVRRILAFSRPAENRRLPIAPLPIVEEVIKLLRATIPAHVEISVHATDNVPLIDIDSTELHQVLLNLGTNAWHAIGVHPGRIRFSLSAESAGAGRSDLPAELMPGRYARIVVSDNGSGMSDAVLPRIFDPFFTTKSPGEGSGLGLSVVHGIVRANGGAVNVSSVVGAGSTFELYFPASTALRVDAPAPIAAAPVPARAGEGESILVVDDEEALIFVAERVLRRAGYHVTTFLRPREALAYFRTHAASVRLVVSDLSMPEMSGLELAREILRHDPAVPVILTSGYLRNAEAEAARALGVREIVEKPNTPHDLLPLIARLIREPPARPGG
jgi:PAS domain S-box-containing protein